jgi:hypothetical protein
MKRVQILIFTGILMFSLFVYSADDPQAKLKSIIKSTYDFDPSKLSDEMKDKKSKEMDVFWELIESDAKTYLPLLRKELSTNGYNQFFYYDGSVILAKLSQSKDDISLVIDSIRKSDLNYVDRYQYFQIIHWAGCQGFNTYPAVETMLNSPKYTIFIPEHSLNLAQDYSVLYCLLPIDEKYYLDAMIERLKKEKNPVIAKTILTVIAFTVTKKGQDAIKSYIESSSDQGVVDYAKQFLTLENKEQLPARQVVSKAADLEKFLNTFADRNYDSKDINMKVFEKDAPYLVSQKDYNLIKKIRNKQAWRVSDEALGEISYLTVLMQFAFTSKN